MVAAFLEAHRDFTAVHLGGDEISPIASFVDEMGSPHPPVQGQPRSLLRGQRCHAIRRDSLQFERMAFGGRVYSREDHCVLGAALVATFFLFAGVAMRVHFGPARCRCHNCWPDGLEAAPRAQ